MKLSRRQKRILKRKLKRIAGDAVFERTTDETTWHNTTLKKLFTHGNHTFYTEE